ncbi:MAG TPA: hypothetical protein VGS80_00640, partial [Ktedonobacterales bacterium]|nr:hypothetical protein [Ktedonobacterales bacterium]
MMEVTQALEAPCRDGSIVVTTTRVQRKGRPTWSIWRSHCSGVSVTSLSASFSVQLHVTDGRRLPILGIAHRDALLLIALLGYAPVEVPDARQAAQPSTELAAPCRGGMLHVTRDLVAFAGTSPWHTPRIAIAGVCAATGPETATLLISMHSGQIVLVDGVAFEHALRAILTLGYLPASIPPLTEVVAHAAMPSARRRRGAGAASLPSPSPVRPRARVVPADRTRSAALRGGRLIPVLSPPEHPSAAANGYARSRHEPMEDRGAAPIAAWPVRASSARGFQSDEATMPHEPARLSLDDIDGLLRKTEEAGGGLLRRLPEWLHLPVVPILPVLHRTDWMRRQARRRAEVAPAAWALPVGPRELHPPDWQQQPDAPAHYERPGAWQRLSMPVRSPWRRPAWLRVPRVRRHDMLPPQVRPAEWQRRPAAAFYARPVEWERQPVFTQAGVRPLEWRRRPRAQRPPSRAAAFVSAVWGAIARPDASAIVLPIALVLLLILIAALGGHSHLAGRASHVGGSFAGQPALRVFASSQDGAIYVLDARTGALVWRY